MKKLMIVAVFILPVLASGCGTTTTSRTLSAGAAGAAGGALLGAVAGSTATGAALGGGVGLVGGYLYDQVKKGNID